MRDMGRCFREEEFFSEFLVFGFEFLVGRRRLGFVVSDFWVGVFWTGFTGLTGLGQCVWKGRGRVLKKNGFAVRG